MSNWTESDLRAFTQRRLKQEERARLEMQQNHETPNPLARLQDSVHKPEARLALVGKPHRAHHRKQRAVIRVSIISVRRRLIDSDNLVAGAKQIRDALAEKLESDDSEYSGIEWEYDQMTTRGTEGTLIRIELL